MYLPDYHTHSLLSPDSSAPLGAMAEAAAAAGLEELCLTDHWDLLTQDGKPQGALDWAPNLAQYAAAAERYAGQITLRLGMEFGVPHLDPVAAEKTLSLPELDFVIGSIHNLSLEKGGGDFYYADYSTPEDCYAALDDYFTSMARLAPSDYYDVLGHIIYPLRYMPRPVPLDRYMDRIQEILRVTVSRGKGIEVNTYRGQTVAAWKPILDLYKACGGEIVTVGSDAHAPEHVGLGIPAACELLVACGFRYVAGYHRRKPVFHKL